VSSVDRPWRHLVLRSYREPIEQELLEAPGLQDLTLMTPGSGAKHLERTLNGRWESADLRMGRRVVRAARAGLMALAFDER
jgi:AraC family transcriptional regulator